VALDHNMPLPLLRAVDMYVPEVQLVPVRQIDPALAELDDNDLVYELARRAWPMMVTANYKMLSDPAVLVALHQTKLTLMAIEGAGHDAILATGALLRDLLPVMRKLTTKGQVFLSRPVAPRPTSPFQLLERVAAHQGCRAADLEKTYRVTNWRRPR